MHSWLNAAAAAAYGASWLARGRGDHARGRDLALLGAVVVSAGGYLGGHLAYSEGVGVNRNADSSPTPKAWTDACAADEVPEGGLLRVDVGGKALVLSRRSGVAARPGGHLQPLRGAPGRGRGRHRGR